MKQTIMLSVMSGLLLCLAAGGCTKFSRERFNAVYTGMHEMEVEELLGPPSTKSPDCWTYTPDKIDNNKDYYFATIHFAGARVTQKTWSDDTSIADDPMVPKNKTSIPPNTTVIPNNTPVIPNDTPIKTTTTPIGDPIIVVD